jgi:hypothetical protein
MLPGSRIRLSCGRGATGLAHQVVAVQGPSVRKLRDELRVPYCLPHWFCFPGTTDRRLAEWNSGVPRIGFTMAVGVGPFQRRDNVSFVREHLLFGRRQFVVGVGGDGHG